ncbi:MAG: putative glycoside hydrolase, partial [Vicinamibacterales bacterium]
KYTVEIAREAATAGADELNFDYIRFPSDGRTVDLVYPVFDDRTQSRRQVIQNFFAYLTTQLRPTGAVLSADVFGLVTVRPDDMGIGQILEDALLHFDVVAPMVYPSHYGRGFMGFRNPAAHPYEVVQYSLAKAAERRFRLAETLATLSPGDHVPDPGARIAVIRPWLQAFDLGAPYPPSAIRTQMQATSDAGFNLGWLLWSPSNKYAAASFLKDPRTGDR